MTNALIDKFELSDQTEKIHICAVLCSLTFIYIRNAIFFFQVLSFVAYHELHTYVYSFFPDCVPY